MKKHLIALNIYYPHKKKSGMRYDLNGLQFLASVIKFYKVISMLLITRIEYDHTNTN